MQSAINQKKRQEEKNSKLLRELAGLPSNRNCFECGQRGPTYVNITEGSFCCTSCSGILRGLNPPHRVKSISMATFTTEEIEKLKNLGNAENSRTWLGLYGGTPPTMTNREDIQAFINKKYEQKAWYVSSAELAEQEKLLLKAKEIASQGASSTSSRSSKPPEIDLFASDPFGSIAQSIPSNTNSIPGDSYNASSALPPHPFSPPACMAPPPPQPSQYQQRQPPSLNPGPPAHPLPPKSPFDVLENTKPVDQAQVKSEGPRDIFADFDNKFNGLSIKSSNTCETFSNIALPPNAIIKSATVSGFNPLVQKSNPFENDMTIGSLTSAPSSVAPPPPVSAPEVKPVQQSDTPTPSLITQSSSCADKYSALAELDQLFHSHPTGQGDSKPAWMPSGFSTGLPPATYTPAFPDPKPAFPDTKPAFSEAKPAFPESRPAVLPNSSKNYMSTPMPKSNTMGAITDYGMNNPFLTSQPHANSQVSLNSNPFASQEPVHPFGAPQQQHQVQPFPQGMNQAWPNPFNSQTPQLSAPSQNTNVSWNPFL
ncbi:unnamed protein product [Auanema sp. JU1783]|nr:unnamed protein product [Auanema sp. JU1783]